MLAAAQTALAAADVNGHHQVSATRHATYISAVGTCAQSVHHALPVNRLPKRINSLINSLHAETCERGGNTSVNSYSTRSHRWIKSLVA